MTVPGPAVPAALQNGVYDVLQLTAVCCARQLAQCLSQLQAHYST